MKRLLSWEHFVVALLVVFVVGVVGFIGYIVVDTETQQAKWGKEDKIAQQKLDAFWAAVGDTNQGRGGTPDAEGVQTAVKQFDQILANYQYQAGVWHKYPNFEAQLRSKEVRGEPYELLHYLAFGAMLKLLPEEQVTQRIRQLQGFNDTMPTPDQYLPLVIMGVQKEMASTHEP